MVAGATISSADDISLLSEVLQRGTISALRAGGGGRGAPTCRRASVRRCAFSSASVTWSFGASPRGSTLAAFSVCSSTNCIASSSVDGWYTSWRRSRSFVVQKCSGRDSAQFSSQSSM